MDNILNAIHLIAIAHAITTLVVIIIGIVEENEWLADIYENDDMDALIKQGFHALTMFPIFLVCTVARRLHRKKQVTDKCRECLYRISVEKHTETETVYDENKN